ncbi:type I-B CRISPR-associated protein Cas7/Csh2 [Cyclobacterium sp. 1_MG-2023]|uniref:type I-B CRISPR-associated protein Cas7/Csh2 n=1 Tax=Cyclobacterium sp. 1_MG-2023 TaxID=3062681 RepID=UPI0026E45FA9|nr:type I-B CRISPR-associated protein Cas7/Csh2 [Cyclobacterium sp. 1_MG-2023]MDO6437056.1 type I-B CRISPR-associated protein Cas7/Csh2 [Cyclobacterium sp. 1_MG-2023]
MEEIKNRSEILFLYEIENANPNGDPLNENRPRFDNEENKVLVSDVRLKRTIRDYWFEYKGFNGFSGKDIFVRETKYSDGKEEFISSGSRRAELFKESSDKVLETCIDVRVFGGVLPIKKDTFTYTGPVQFQMGKSLHQTEIITEQGTGAFASGDKKKQTTFRTEYKIPYALIGFNGIVNEKSAQYTKMTEEDRKLLLEGIWNGTKNLISRSKFGQNPLLLFTVNYKEPYYIGGLRQRLKINSEKSDLQIRNTEDYKIDLTGLLKEIKVQSDKITSVEVQVDSRLEFLNEGESYTLENKTYTVNDF